MNRSNTPKEVLGGQDGKTRCQCGKLRYPRYKLYPKCYYEREEGLDSSQPQSTREHQPTAQQLTPDRLKNLSTAEVLQMRSPMRISLPDRHERIQLLEKQHGKTFSG